MTSASHHASSILVLVEHQNGRLKPASLSAVTFAGEFQRLEGGECDLLLIGQDLAALGAELGSLGARAVLLADDPALVQPLADRYAAALVQVVRERGAGTIIAASSTFSKDILPRAAALLDAGMLTDVVGVEATNSSLRFRRPVYAGNAIATVELAGTPRVLLCRPTAFPGASLAAETRRHGEEWGVSRTQTERIAIDPQLLPEGTQFVSREERPSARPELTEARVVVSGGRPLRDRETFLQVLGGLADALGGALGATRAAVDSGIAPNDWQVGQTGKVVAPEVYIACGVSGSIQHLAGMKDSRVIVAINKDPEAPIFEWATYGLVADLFDAVPALAGLVRKSEPDTRA